MSLDTSDPATLSQWIALPPTDHRTIAEFSMATNTPPEQRSTPAPPVIMDEKARAHALLEQLARDAGAATLVASKALYEKAVEEHTRQRDGYRFECSRFGDFLQLRIERKGNPTTPQYPNGYSGIPEQRFATTLNLHLCTNFSLVEGSAPDEAGESHYRYSRRNISGASYYGGTDGDTMPPKGVEFYVYGDAPYLAVPYDRPMFRILEENEKPPHPGMVYGGHSTQYRIQYTTKGFVRLSQDDQIVFGGLRAIVFAPAGLGAHVLETIHKTLATDTP